ncbi:serine hydrolase domain-containing protein [Treponema lecithinolyticum]|uniref:Beta-lactamase n=1 Tax=Treponema lecithinolyticum ATCC 700332 TaxID=1321815 RepID=A0ABN0NY46_TRELE|nr:serine hydrolase domain-containing protein [Treponema lecithinolyticum]ERJ92419.1 beta-lactamase [Treponema lecithinolyticum ATCC 700332]
MYKTLRSLSDTFRRLCRAAVFFLCLCAGFCTAASLYAAAAQNAQDVQPLQNGYENIVDGVAASYVGKSVPGACVIIAEHGTVVFSKCYGYTNLDTQQRIRPDTDFFEWGSITKTLVWVSALQLEEKGLLDLNADIRRYLPDNFLRNLRYDAPITMLDLMNHTAGFEEYLIDFRYLNEQPVKPLVDVLSAHQPAQVFEPGSVSAYSNWGAALAGFIVERISGQSFDEYVTEHIFTPLGIQDAELKPQWTAETLKKKINGYSYSKKGFRKEDFMRLRLYPAGSLNGTPNALIKYAAELAKKSGEHSLLFSDPATKDKLFGETYRSFGAASGLAHGFWEYTKNNGIFGHEGGTYGFKTQLWVQPERERAILIATNVMESDFCRSLMNELVQSDRAQAGNGSEGESLSASGNGNEGERVSANTNGSAGTNAAAGTDTADFARFSGEYFPARSVWTHAGKLNGYMQMISIQQNTDGTGIVLKKRSDGKSLTYRSIGNNRFYCKEALPEEQYVAFKTKNGDVLSMTFFLAHDYVPAKGRYSTGFLLSCTAAFVLAFVFWLGSGIALAVSGIRAAHAADTRAPVMRAPADRLPKVLCAACGLIADVSIIAGMRNWFAIYTIDSVQMNLIVAINAACALCTVCSCVYLFYKKRFGPAVMFSAACAVQLYASVCLGFFHIV